MKENKLKPCPFCGEHDIAFYSYDPYDGYMGDLTLYCVKCRLCGACIKEISPEKAHEAWNRRANDEGAD